MLNAAHISPFTFLYKVDFLVHNLLFFCLSGHLAANMGSMRILIKGGKVVNDDFTQEADVYIENGIIQQVR